MQINPGGRLNTSDVVGRDNEIARYWRVLERQGLVISAERRIGKTHIVLKMRDECRSGFLPLYQDLESVHSTAELIRSIYATVHQFLSTVPGLRAHVAKWSSLLPEKIGGVDLATGAGTWQVLLSQAFDDLIDIADERLILMLWDEFPLMLQYCTAPACRKASKAVSQARWLSKPQNRNYFGGPEKDYNFKPVALVQFHAVDSICDMHLVPDVGHGRVSAAGDAGQAPVRVVGVGLHRGGLGHRVVHGQSPLPHQAARRHGACSFSYCLRCWPSRTSATRPPALRSIVIEHQLAAAGLDGPEALPGLIGLRQGVTRCPRPRAWRPACLLGVGNRRPSTGAREQPILRLGAGSACDCSTG